MKYLVFWSSVAGMVPLAWVLSLERKWIRWAFFGMIVGIYAYQPTAINFFSHEWYKGTARGMEISLIHLLAATVLLALAIRGKRQRMFPEGGIRIYALYFLFCLPSLWNADNVLFGWLEVWKMVLLFLFWHAVYGYLRATGDLGTVVRALAFFTLANSVCVVRQHFGGAYQTVGVFPIWNSLGLAMNLLGPLFFAGYLQMGLHGWTGWLCTAAFMGAALSSVWSYSRAAIVTIPIAYGMAALGCLIGTKRRGRMLWRLAPMVLIGLLGVCVAWPHIVERFLLAPKRSGETRKEMAYCAWEMIKAHPFAGVGINNVSLNMEDNHPYRARASEKLGRDLDIGGVVEAMYLLVGAECGIPALAALLAWFGWHLGACLRASWRLRGTQWHFAPVGIAGGIAANSLQGILDWALRQQMNLFLLVFCFAMVAWLRTLRPEKEKVA